eukprot:1195915-Prorocentrum_minimum.AAC.3
MKTTLNLHLTYAHRSPDSKSGIIAEEHRKTPEGQICHTSYIVSGSDKKPLLETTCGEFCLIRSVGLTDVRLVPPGVYAEHPPAICPPWGICRTPSCDWSPLGYMPNTLLRLVPPSGSPDVMLGVSRRLGYTLRRIAPSRSYLQHKY